MIESVKGVSKRPKVSRRFKALKQQKRRTKQTSVTSVFAIQDDTNNMRLRVTPVFLLVFPVFFLALSDFLWLCGYQPLPGYPVLFVSVALFQV